MHSQHDTHAVTLLCISPNRGPWKVIDDVEIATAEWVHWFNTYRPHGALGGATPAAFRSDYFSAMPWAA
ncbi:integrase core domain-containing protein [Brevibacterium sp. FAM 25378]|uniref:integrase core domain-containing protein n=1 Tax=Brevibacterium sp. FAM 25378 TaxID=3415682 RepID=UPI001091F66E|nr:hypothetical protein EB835_06555 [Brevibacterium sp. S22]